MDGQGLVEVPRSFSGNPGPVWCFCKTISGCTRTSLWFLSVLLSVPGLAQHKPGWELWAWPGDDSCSGVIPNTQREIPKSLILFCSDSRDKLPGVWFLFWCDSRGKSPGVWFLFCCDSKHPERNPQEFGSCSGVTPNTQR